MNTNRDFLDKFGEFLMSEVRDRAIRNWESVISGRMRGERAQEMRTILADFSEDQLKTLVIIAPFIVDSMLHHLLFSLEGEEEIDVSVSIDGETRGQLRDMSDGLTGELYGDTGWIEKFSKYKQGSE